MGAPLRRTDQSSTASDDPCAPLLEDLAHQRAVAAALVLAVAADREARGVGQRGQQVPDPARLRPAHLGAVAARERAPAALVAQGGPGFLQQLLARSQVREPHVVQVARRVLALRDAPWRPAHGSDPHSLALAPRASQTHDANGHLPSPSCGAKSVAGWYTTRVNGPEDQLLPP